MSFPDPVLPYEMDALKPHISEKTLKYHVTRHHQGYIDKLNEAIKGTRYAGLDLEDVVVRSREDADTTVYRNAAQAWNHDFFWHSMSPNGGNPTGKIKNLINLSYSDGVAEFKRKFKEAATGLFGSGWVWLVLENGRLNIIQGANAESPLRTGVTLLLGLDVWEHAYYLDYQSDRAGYVDVFLENLINWDFAASNLDRVATRAAA